MERGVPASPYIVREVGLQVGLGREYYSSTSMSPLYSAGHVQLPNRVLLLCSPCASRHQVPCSASQVVTGAHRVVGPGTHQVSGPREVHTTPNSDLAASTGQTVWSHRSDRLVPLVRPVRLRTGSCKVHNSLIRTSNWMFHI
jgi:hypothetical protein